MKPQLNRRQWDLLAFGDAVADMVIASDALPAKGDKVVAQSLGTFPGGTTANVACAAAKLGMRSAFFGRIGDDHYGELLQKSFQDFSVSCEFLQRPVGSSSARAISIILPDGEKVIYFLPMTSTEISYENLRPALAQSQIVYCMPYDEDEFEMITEAARIEKTLIAVDIESAMIKAGVDAVKLLAQVDIAFFNESGFFTAMGSQPEPQLLAELLKLGPQVIVVSLGAHGAVGISKNGYAEQAAFSTLIRDTTGAGDSFNAAFLRAYLESEDLQNCLQFACAAASFCLNKVGARSSLPGLMQVQQLLSESHHTHSVILT